MNLGFMKPMLLSVRNFTVQHSTTILTSVGVAGVVGTAVSASIATAKSYKAVHERQSDEPLTKKEIVKICWKYYIPPAMIATTTVGAIIGSNVISGKKEAALASACALAERSFSEYQSKVADKFGSDEAKRIKEENIMSSIAATDSNDINAEWIFAHHGKTLCYDYYCGRYFYSDPAYLRSCESEINRQYLLYGSLSLHDVYDEIGFIAVSDLARRMVWVYEPSYSETLRFLFKSALTADNKPVLVVQMNDDPKYEDATYI